MGGAGGIEAVCTVLTLEHARRLLHHVGGAVDLLIRDPTVTQCIQTDLRRRPERSPDGEGAFPGPAPTAR